MYKENEIEDMISHVTGEREDFMLDVVVTKELGFHVSIPNYVLIQGIKSLEKVEDTLVVTTNEGNNYQYDLTLTCETLEPHIELMGLVDSDGSVVYE